jgi:hypothetical protein
MRFMPLALNLLLPAIASATDVRGTLSTHTVWTRSGSPYLLKGDVTVAWGTRLTLEPGVQVIAAPEDTLDSGVDPQRVELIIDGTLVVRGTRERPVEFTTQGDNGSWYGIRVRGGRGTVIDGALITRAHQGLSLGMSAVVRNTSVSATSEDCLQVSWGRATLEGNRLNGCGLHLSEWARLSLREAPVASTFPQPAFAEARVRGRTVFSSRDSRVPEVVTHVASRPARRQELIAIGGGGNAGLPRPERLVDPRPLGSRPSSLVLGLPAHPSLAAIPLLRQPVEDSPPPRASPTLPKRSEPDPLPLHALPGRSDLHGTAGRRPSHAHRRRKRRTG